VDNVTTLGILIPRFIGELVAAFLCGALLGFERGSNRRGLGLRETTLISLGAALLMIVGELADISTGEGGVPTDPGRLAGYIIVAGGLLSIGASFRRRGDLHPLSAAATVWIAVGVGLLAGVGYPLLATMITAAIMVVLMIVRWLESHLVAKPRSLLLKITAREDNPELRSGLQAALAKFGIYADSFRVEKIPNGVKLTIAARSEPADLRPLMAALWTVPGVNEVEH